MQQSELEKRLEREDREKFEVLRLSETDRARWQLSHYLRAKSDPWFFLSNCVWTLDQVSSSPVKPYPSYLEYLELLTHLWVKHKLIGCPKSRRMHASWTFISLYLHDTVFNPGRFNAFVARKEESAGELVSRSEFIYNNIPTWRIPKELLPKIRSGSMTKKPPVLDFEETHSKIQGFPQGADQLRQFTLSGILGDESAFWEEAEAFYSASKPTLDGGGRMTLISSRSPGFFKKIVFDRISSKDYNFPEIPTGTVKHPMEGVEVWKNKDNGFLIIDLDYKADPAKRSPEWEAAVRGSLPSWQFEMEYGKSWSAYVGKKVFPDFKKGLHSTRSPIVLEPGLPILLGVDFGLTPAVILCQLVGTQLRAVKEWIEQDGSIRKLAPEVMGWLKLNCPNYIQEGSFYTFVDPAGAQRSQVDESTCIQELQKQGFLGIRPGPVVWEVRRAAVEHFLTRLTPQGPALLVSEVGCPLLFEGLAGGYRYPDSYLEVAPDKARPIKDKYSHPADAFQYVCDGARHKIQHRKITIPEPHYTFQKGN